MSGKRELVLTDFPSGFFLGLSIQERRVGRNKKVTELFPADQVLPKELIRLRSVLEKVLGCRVVLNRNRKTHKCCLRIHGRHGDTFEGLKESIKGKS